MTFRHVEHHSGATIFALSSHGELRTLTDTVNTLLRPTTTQPRNIWVVVAATVDIHLTKRRAELPLQKALEYGLTTQALVLWMAFRGMHPVDTLHILKQESHPHIYGNGRADRYAKQHNTNHTPEVKHVRLDTPRRHSLPTGYPMTRDTQTETYSTTTPHQSNNLPPHCANRRTPNSCDTSRTPSVAPSTT